MATKTINKSFTVSVEAISKSLFSVALILGITSFVAFCLNSDSFAYLCAAGAFSALAFNDCLTDKNPEL